MGDWIEDVELPLAFSELELIYAPARSRFIWGDAMTETKEIRCDGCEKDLTSTSNSVDYRIILGNQNIPSRGGFVTDMMAYPAIDGGSKHFCGARCLRKWVVENISPERAVA